MSNISNLGAHFSLENLGRFIPSPKSVNSGFSTALRAAGDVAKAVTSNVVSISPEYQALIERQIEMQTQMQLVSMESNIEKSKHETVMNPIRNVRVA